MAAPLDLRCAVLVPCRDEQDVIERKLLNLMLLQSSSPHPLSILVIDDHCQDKTAEKVLAFAALHAGPLISIQLTENDVRPGKNGAIEAGLAALPPGIEVVILTDADVLVCPDAIGQLSLAFAETPSLGMLCGTQVFVEDLPEDGDSRPLADAPRASDAWDRATRFVRHLESRRGKLFSVHGQWLAWRLDLNLSPAPGVAADDVDLMLQARVSSRPRVSMLPSLYFYESKPAGGESLDDQALRRARAWFQVFDRPGVLRGWRGVDALQGAMYMWLPGAAPMGAVLLIPSLLLCVFWLGGGTAAVSAALLMGLIGLSGPGRAWNRTLGLIRKAKRLESQEAMGESWEMSRE